MQGKKQRLYMRKMGTREVVVADSFNEAERMLDIKKRGYISKKMTDGVAVVHGYVIVTSEEALRGAYAYAIKFKEAMFKERTAKKGKFKKHKVPETDKVPLRIDAHTIIFVSKEDATQEYAEDYRRRLEESRGFSLKCGFDEGRQR